MLNAHITANRKAVDNTTVQVDLVWLLSLNQDCFGLVTLIGGEDLVGLGGGDGEGPFDGTEFIFFDKPGIYQLS